MNWIRSAKYDSLFILSPPFLCLFLIFLFPNFFQNQQNNNEWIWFILVVCIDVGHVYSTIYRTYLDKETINKNKSLFILSPILLYIFGVIVHHLSPLMFWRLLAYLAVFHFIRQQYGFLKLYSRNQQKNKYTIIDNIAIYSATIYPLLIWHLNGIQTFNWFIDNDFFYFNLPAAIPVLNILYLIILILYFIKEIYISVTFKSINFPKNLLLIGTIVSWYFGIVYFHGDLTFTLLNVVSHGIPYIALVWAFGNKSVEKNNIKNSLAKLFNKKYILFFILLILLLAYVEEMLWDGFIWHEHLVVFPTSQFLPSINQSNLLLSIVIPLLALPQILHYFIDGFIWKMHKDQFGWLKILFEKKN